MLIETSALVEYFIKGPQVERILLRIQARETPLYIIPTVEFEAASVLSSRMKLGVTAVEKQILKFIERTGAIRTAITPDMGALAIDALARYGKGRGHPAQLNFGDCFSYAAAKALGLPLLYVGQDFARTDLA